MNIRNILMMVSLVLSVLIGLVIGRGGRSNSATNATSIGAVSSPGSGAGSNSKQVLIGLSLDTLKEERWQNDRDMFVKRATELGAKVQVQSANSNDSQQMKDVQSLLTSGVNVLVIAAHDGVAMANAVKMAHAAGVPVIAYDRMIRNSDPDLYLSFDNVRVGELQAQYVVDHLPNGKGSIVCIYGSPSDNNAKLFKQGQDKVLNPLVKKGDIKIVRADWAQDWKPENAKKIMNAAITEGKKFDAVLAANDGTAGGAIQALVEAGMGGGKVIVTGQDSELAACQRIARGGQSMTIYKPLNKLASTAAESAIKLANGKSVVANQTVNNGQIDVPSILDDVEIVTKENMVPIVVKQGFHTYDEIYGSVPAAQRPPRP